MSENENAGLKLSVLELSVTEETAIIRWLNSELRDYGHTMTQVYANTLNGIFVKLAGHNHGEYDRREGVYGKQK